MMKGMWKGDIRVSGFIPFNKAKQFYGQDAEQQIKQAKEAGLTRIYQETYCGHLVQVASVEVRAFLACGVIPTIEGTLNDQKVVE
jgi:hypothetical protein